jgi:membrane protein implicated in regulation of membrane protease activity
LLILVVISITAAILLLVRLLMLRREIRRMTEKLHRYNEQLTGKKIERFF